MKLISWNVNGLRACIKKGFPGHMAGFGADVVCLQETKMDKGLAEKGLGQLGIDLSGQSASSPGIFREYWNSAEKKGYSGTAVFTKIPPLSVICGIGRQEHDREGRVITLEFDAFYLVNVYTPNSQRELTRLDYRMQWEDAFREYVCGLDEKKPVIICGDMNVAHTEMDIKNAKSNVHNAGFTQQERDKMTALLGAGFTDFYRHLHPDKRDAYTWWSYMGNSREKNIGWRIDYFLGSNRLTDKVNNAFILPEIMGSDHCPVGLEIF